ncbi:MAG: FtsW/RodA/SpoVE family cell cycle protein [Anaerolineae bacterium]
MADKKPRQQKRSSMDSLLLVTLLALLAFGLIMLYSATFYVGMDFWQHQLIWVVVGGVAMVVTIVVPYTLWKRFASPVMGITLLLLLLVLFLGDPKLGAYRSLEIFGVSVQPGVLARLTAVIYMSAWLASKGEQLHQVRYGLVPFAVIMGIVAGLVALQPDLSIALLLVVTGMAMFFFAGGDPIQIFSFILLGGMTFGLLAWQLPHARQRLLDYVASLKDPTVMPYHVRQATTAIGSGGIFGRGVGNGWLKAGYLPLSHTDSIFAVIGEEVGLLGTLLVLALFVLLAYRGYTISLEAGDPFGSLLAFGLTTMIIAQALLNVTVMVGLVPFSGTALPFFSYGGSEMVVTLAASGLLLNVSRGKPRGDANATLDRWWRDWWTRLSRARRRRSVAGR